MLAVNPSDKTCLKEKNQKKSELYCFCHLK